MLMKDHTRRKRKGGKIDHKWLGPYSITRVLGKGLYALEDVKTNQLVERVNGYHLKPYRTPPSSPHQVSSLLHFPNSTYGSGYIFVL